MVAFSHIICTAKGEDEIICGDHLLVSINKDPVVEKKTEM